MLISIIAHDTLRGVSCVTLRHTTFNENPKQIPSLRKPVSALNRKVIIKHMVCLGKDRVPQTVGIRFLGQCWLPEAELYVFLVTPSSSKCAHCQIIKSSHVFQQDTSTLPFQFWPETEQSFCIIRPIQNIYRKTRQLWEQRAQYKLSSSNTDQGLVSPSCDY